MNTVDLHTLAQELSSQDIPLPPSKEAIDTLITSLRELLFPHTKRNAETGTIQLEWIQHELAKLIADAMAVAEQGDHSQKAEEITNAFLASLPQIQDMARRDVEAALKGDPAAKSPTEVIAYYPGFFAILVNRIAHTLHSMGVPFIPRGMTEFAHSRTGIDIHPGATIGKGFFIDHGTGVVIGETTEIGEDVILYQGVTLGALSFRHDENGKVIREAKRRHPKLEDRVTIYANATVLGGDTIIGHDSIVGSSVWLTESIEPYSKVGMKPPEVRMKKRETT
ncbi:serine acetyltransferase [Candidatus Peregrinibacteria bacterium CG10_big_fil_rev_8_21_14_0_10_49_10]|nr:MAG: serine acetyltransferase [Candidatus Peregrinibacteria bacterium CG10_big_fil_rev_8_21_14_0_10_49_10]